MSGEREFYILSLKWTRAPNRLATWWRPDNAGYCWHLPQAGRYPESAVREKLDYYNSGCGTIAIPCDVVDAVAKEYDLPHEPKRYVGVRRHWATLRRLVRSAPFPLHRPEYVEDRWKKIVPAAHQEEPNGR